MGRDSTAYLHGGLVGSSDRKSTEGVVRIERSRLLTHSILLWLRFAMGNQEASRAVYHGYAWPSVVSGIGRSSARSPRQCSQSEAAWWLCAATIASAALQ